MTVVLGLVALPAGAGAVSTTELATVPGYIVDATPERVLYRPPLPPEVGDPADGDPLVVRDVSSGTDTTVPDPAGREAVVAPARLFGTDGVLFVTKPISSGPDPDFELDEWHTGDAAPTSLGAINSKASLEVAEPYAIWNDDNVLKRRDLTGASVVTISTVASPSQNSVAANGDVVFSDGGNPAHVFRWRSGVTTQLSDSSTEFAVGPLTDGVNTVYQPAPTCCGFDGGSVVLHDGTTRATLPGSKASSPRFGYDVAGGWAAYRSGDGTQVSVRDAADPHTVGVVSDDGNPGSVALQGMSPTGQVAYNRPLAAPGSFIGTPGHHALPLGPMAVDPFFHDDRWYALRYDSTADEGTLLRLETDTVFAKRPPDATPDDTAHFELASTARDPEFTCTFEGNPASCADGDYTASALAEGEHTFTATSHDPDLDEDDPTPATLTWFVDATPPSQPGLDAPADDAAVRPGERDLSWSPASDPDGSGIGSYDVLIDGDVAGSTGSATTTFHRPPLADGPHTWKVRAVDRAGNTHDSATRQFTVDGLPPSDPERISPAQDETVADARPTFRWDAAFDTGTGVAAYEVEVDDVRFRVDGDATSFTPPQDIPDGVHYWFVFAFDEAGNEAGNPVGRRLTIDTSPRSEPGPPGVSINGGDVFTNDPDVTLTLRWPARARTFLASNDGGFDGAEPRPLEFHVPWRLETSGPERLPKTVYIRYLGGTAGNETYQDDIILDQGRPLILLARFVGGAGAARASKRHRYRIKLRARDGVSGLRKAQVARRKRHPARPRVYRKTLRLRAKARPRWVRVRDRAGNWSRWRRIARRH